MHRTLTRLVTTALIAGAVYAPAPLAAQSKLDDATIVAIFDAANGADIETASLAAKLAKNKDVRELGAMFVRDHSTVRDQGRALAKKLGVVPTPPADDQAAKDHAAAMASLSAKTGADFDRAFVAHEVAYHAAVIDALTKTLLPAISNHELKAFVLKIAPAFQAHLLAAQNLQKKLG